MTDSVLALGCIADPGWLRLANHLDIDVVVAPRPELFPFSGSVLAAPGGPESTGWLPLISLLGPAELICARVVPPLVGRSPVQLPWFSSLGREPRTLWPGSGTPVCFPDGPLPRVLIVMAEAAPVRHLLTAIQPWGRVSVVAPGLSPRAAVQAAASSRVHVTRSVPDVRHAECALLITDLPHAIAGDFLHRGIPVASFIRAPECVFIPPKPETWASLFQQTVASGPSVRPGAVEDVLPALVSLIEAARC